MVQGTPAAVAYPSEPEAEAAGGVELLSAPRDPGFVEQWYDYAEHGHFWFRWRLWAALRQMRDVGLPVESPLRALEIGAGTGVLRDQLETATAWAIDICDLHREALRRARPGRGRILYYDVLERRPEMQAGYDVVVAFDVIEHLPDAAGFLRAAVAHLRPGGHLLVNVPAVPRFASAYDVAVGHLRRYLPATLASELDGTRVELCDIRYWGLSLVPLLLLRKRALRGRVPVDVVRTGFRPPGALANALLGAVGRLETALLGRPPVGTSLLLAGRLPA